jgi:hypothetical protein
MLGSAQPEPPATESGTHTSVWHVNPVGQVPSEPQVDTV